MPRPPSPPKGVVSVPLTEAIEQFLSFIRSENAPSTLASKQVVMRGAQDALGAQRLVWTLTTGDFRSVLTFLNNGADDAEAARREAAGRRTRPGRATQGSRNAVESVLRQFIMFCHDGHWLQKGEGFPKPITKGRKPTHSEAGEKPSPQFAFPLEAWPRLLISAGEIHARVRMAFALGLYCGRRVSESQNLQWQDIDWTRNEIRFYEDKKGEYFLFPLFPEIREEFERWVRWAAEAGYGDPQPDWYLIPCRIDTRYIRGVNSRARLRNEPTTFPVELTKRVDYHSIAKDVRRVFDHEGVPPGQNTHVFRRSAAKVFSRRYGLSAAQALLNHKRITTTQIYTANDEGYDTLVSALMAGGAFTPELAASDDLPANVIQLRRRTA